MQARFQTTESGIRQIFDIVRKKFVALNPEEWVRQHLIHYLVQYKQVPLSMISVEKQLLLNGTKRRTDVVIYNNSLKPLAIIECKAPEIVLDQKAVNQILRYNLALNVPYIFISNGNQHISIKITPTGHEILKEFPDYIILNG